MSEMKHCMACGAALKMKYHPDEETMVPFCERCGDWRFPVFSAAVSMVTLSPDRKRVLLIRQYGRPFWILPAGYINRGEDAESAVCREIREELGLGVLSLRFNRTHYYPPSNTLMLNFEAAADSVDVRPNKEVDDWRWFDEKGARENVRPDSLAQRFLEGYFTGVYPWE